jgi:hypothetical protein
MGELTTTGSDGSVYWLGHIPCHIMHVIGVVVGIDVCDRWMVYTGKFIFFSAGVTHTCRS